MFALANVGPVAVNVDAIPMQSYGGGLFTGYSDEATHIDHVVQLVGYGFDATFGKNSCGTAGGRRGGLKATCISSAMIQQTTGARLTSILRMGPDVTEARER